ncbi:MAG TPA: saccharopine dehydrogenase C-terminal domain-containing protein [Blastocatellia bacterium]|nr:saccharopine dehydrogenase C-terminal domain-containing protein [Blastocatellia bacterium]
MKILVLGAGRMGLGAAFDLIHNSGAESVTIADVDAGRLSAVAERIGSPKLVTEQADASDYGQAVGLMRGHDAAISCVVYPLNHQLARAAIEAKVSFCDLGGNNDVVASELALDQAAREAGINIIPDCGLAPGMVSVLVAHGSQRFDKLEEVHIRVGGLPLDPRPPFNYQLIFSVEGLINEYVERARVVRGGRIVEVESMTEVESLDFPGFGTMEAFQTSGGTSTLPETFLGSIKELDYKTIRYPGHCEKFKALIEAGMMSGQEIEVDGARVRPRRVLAEMLTRLLPADGPDAVLIRVEFRGEREGGRRQLRYDIIDKYDEATGLSAMMRTTAFPASIIAQMMARGETAEKGAIPQERCVPPDAFVKALAARNIRIDEQMTEA